MPIESPDAHYTYIPGRERVQPYRNRAPSQFSRYRPATRPVLACLAIDICGPAREARPRADLTGGSTLELSDGRCGGLYRDWPGWPRCPCPGCCGVGKISLIASNCQLPSGVLCMTAVSFSGDAGSLAKVNCTVVHPKRSPVASSV